MNPAAAKRFRLLASVLSVLVLIAGAAGTWYYFRLKASLPQLAGTGRLPSLTAAVTIERDALGVPTIRGSDRLDVSRALGWVHAQERFFQMDLLRRRGAGELAELFGKTALPLDRATRMHGFRRLAREVVARLSPRERALLESYVVGVNAGLAALREKPFEYLVLRESPRAWLAEDSILVAYAMTLDLQGDNGGYERSLMVLRDQLGPEALAFFAPLLTPGDAALDGSVGSPAPIPSAKVLDLRRPRQASVEAIKPGLPHEEALHPGSNSFALSRAHTASGTALVANDMHLDLGVPNTWFRASLEWSTTSGASRAAHKVTGITLPGAPMIIAGSNGRVAWGFTSANTDSSDLVVVELTAGSTQLYRTPESMESVQIETRQETIQVNGEPAATETYAWTKWGPIVGVTAEKKPLALRWTAHDLAAVNLQLSELEDAANAREAIAVAHRAGMPAQNFLVADADGTIAWTIAGQLPKRTGFSGRLPVSWSFGDRRWEGFLPGADVPVQIAPESGRLWSANQRMLGGEALDLLGDGGYAQSARAAQIRDRLATLTQASPKDLLAIQLDDRALFLERWQKFLLATLSPPVVAQRKSRAALRAAVEKWEGHASVESVSYRLVREFHRAVARRVLTPIFEPCIETDPAFEWSKFHYETALWTLVQEKPAHLLNPEFASWDALLAAAADDVLVALDREHTPLGTATWGRHNILRARHPFARAAPGFLTGWLNLPADPLPGGAHMPRVQTPGHGASNRFVVAPGREAEGIFHMPGGQSGHPLSPNYRAGHEAWVAGNPTPFLPGKTEHTLTLSP